MSQAGEKDPLSLLLEDLDPPHPKFDAFQKLEACSKQLLAPASNRFNESQLGPNTVRFALLGTDLLVDENGDIEICEVKSHPALGWGTMSKVPSKVFSDLIEEALSVFIDGDGTTER
jgi:hypothetical protein